MPDDPKIEALLSEIIDRARIEAPAAAAGQLAELAGLVESWGARMNLSGHRSARSICEALIADAIGLLAELERAMGRRLAGRIVDLGSGAGFPGLPLAILRPEADVHLVEIREKRHLFQKAAIRQLGLANAHPVRARIEEHATGPADLVVAQAVGQIGEVVELMRPYLAEGAFAAVPGGAELESPPSARDLDPRLIEYRSLVLDQPRRLWLGRRSSR